MLKLLKKKHICIKQNSINNSAFYCLTIIAKHYGIKIFRDKIKEIEAKDNTDISIDTIIKEAGNIGFSAKAIKIYDQKELFSKLPLPAIACLPVGNSFQYVVIHNISHNKIIVADSSKGILEYTPDEFFCNWSGILLLLVPNIDIRKKENDGLGMRFFYLLKPYKSLIVHIFFISLIYTVIGILGSFYFKFLLDDILPNSLEKTLNIITVGVIIINIIKVTLELFRKQLLLYLSQKIDIPLILGFYNHVLNLPISFFETRKTGDILSRFMDASKIKEAISSATLTILMDTLMVVAGAIILYMENDKLFIIPSFIMFLYAILVFLFKKPIAIVNQEVMENSSKLNSYLYESLNGVYTIKSFNVEKQSQLKTEKNFICTLKALFKRSSLNNLQNAITGGIANIGEIVILWVGSKSVISGQMSVGELLTFNSLLVYFMNPIKNLINLQTEMQTAVVAAKRLGEILDLKLEKDFEVSDKVTLNNLKGDIEFKNVNFRHGNNKLTLKNINLKIKKGEKIALIGESGSGKTTLIKLLFKLYNPEEGEILINGTNIQDISMEYLREKIGYVPQETFLFNDTILKNLKFVKKDVTMNEILEVCKLTKVHDFVNKLPKRYETKLEENGANLSGGQRQRLSIARAMLKNPDILIMDEATSNLDANTERSITNIINKLNKDRIVIIIAHRLSTIKECDKIFVLQSGEIRERGNHNQLIDKKCLYYTLYMNQIGLIGGLPRFAKNTTLSNFDGNVKSSTF